MTLDSARAIEPGLRRRGLTVGTRAVLEVVADREPMTVPQIAGILDVSRQAAQRLVNDLRDAGHVRLEANPRHRRSPLVDLTTQGSDAFEGLRSDELEQLSAFAPEVTDRDLETARRVMLALAAEVRAAARDARTRDGAAEGTDP